MAKYIFWIPFSHSFAHISAVSFTKWEVLYTVRKLLIPPFKRDTLHTKIPTNKRAIHVFFRALVACICQLFPMWIAYFKMSVWPVRCALQDEILHLLWKLDIHCVGISKENWSILNIKPSHHCCVSWKYPHWIEDWNSFQMVCNII